MKSIKSLLRVMQDPTQSHEKRQLAWRSLCKLLATDFKSGAQGDVLSLDATRTTSN